MLNSQDSKKYRQIIEQVYPGFFERLPYYSKSIDETHELLGKDFFDKIRYSNEQYKEKLSEREILNLAYTFLKRVNIGISSEFAEKARNNEIKFIKDNDVRVGGNANYKSENGITAINIKYTGNLIDASVVLHEFMHSKTNKFGGNTLSEKAENKKYQEELSIMIELCFAKFLLGINKYKSDAIKILNYRFRNALLSSPGAMQTKQLALYYADKNMPQSFFEDKFGDRLKKVEYDIKNFIPFDIEEYYLGTMSAVENIRNGNEINKLNQIFGLIEQNDFENVKKIVPISYDAQRDRNNLLDFYKLFEDKSKERDDS